MEIFYLSLLLAFAVYVLLKQTAVFNDEQKSRSARQLAEEARDLAAQETAEEIKRGAEKSAFEQWRDAENQDRPFNYTIGRHALETLAMRFGIPHVHNDGSEKSIILIRKISPTDEPNRFVAILPDYRDRKVNVVIERGTDYVKTFLPLDDRAWFTSNTEWETALKGNSGFTIKEIAAMHVQRLNVSR